MLLVKLETRSKTIPSTPCNTKLAVCLTSTFLMSQHFLLQLSFVNQHVYVGNGELWFLVILPQLELDLPRRFHISDIVSIKQSIQSQTEIKHNLKVLLKSVGVLFICNKVPFKRNLSHCSNTVIILRI